MKKKMLFSTIIGNALEYYDFTLYGFFAAFLSPLYFPSDDPTVSKIASLGAFAAGFLMRPIGGLIFGHIGDRYGRKTALLLSILLITIPTLTIGILPTYAYIGFWAPLIIVICRIAQGACTAGEYTGSAILIAEYKKRFQPGFACSLLPASSLIGAILATVLSSICLMDIMPSWAWRIPFILGFAFGLFGFYLRNQIDESPVFTNLTERSELKRAPLVEIFMNQRRNFLCAIGIGAAALAPFYVTAVYIISLSSKLDIAPSHSMLLNAGVMVLWMLLIPVVGYFSDKVGLARMMSYGAILLMIVSVPVFWFVNYETSLNKVIIAQALISCCGAFYVGPSAAFLATKLFPASDRYSGVALGVSIGEAIFGGTTPLIATGLVLLTGAAIAPGFYLMFCSLIGLIVVNLYSPLHSLELGSKNRKQYQTSY